MKLSSPSGIDLAGKTVLLRQSFFRKGLTNTDHLFVCHGGFGCSPCAMGTKVFGKFLSDGEESFVRRSDVEAIVDQDG